MKLDRPLEAERGEFKIAEGYGVIVIQTKIKEKSMQLLS
jgi:hypothetical protein